MTAPAAGPALTASPVLLRADADAIAVLTLNRPHARNALSEELLAALADELTRIASDRSLRAAVIAASGLAFCAGHDLKELTAHRSGPDGGRAYYEHIMRLCSAVMCQVVRLPQPVIAAVQGPATAAGCQLVASCDLAIASQAATFATPGVNIGLFCSTPMVALSRNVAPKHAMEMLLIGEPISADHALRIGLINRVVAAGNEHAAALDLARKIAAKSGHVVKIGKEGFYRQLDMGLDEAYRHAADAMVNNMMARDAEEGIGAFIAKRPPTWNNR